MVRKFSIVVLAFFMSGCAYNSRNLAALTGNNMTFSWGLLAAKGVSQIIILRETNMGRGEAKYNIPDMGQYMCPIPVVTESKEKDLMEMNETKPAEPTTS